MSATVLDGSVSSASPVPFWGPIDANMDWCEPNYAFTPYIAELLNTLSSLPLSLYGLYGLYYSYRYNQSHSPRFTVGFLIFITVGIGSMAFHATLRRWAQALDELPMMWAAILLMHNTLDNHSKWRIQREGEKERDREGGGGGGAGNGEGKTNGVNGHTNGTGGGGGGGRGTLLLKRIVGIYPNPLSHRFNLKLLLILLAVSLTSIYFYFPNLFIFFFLGYGITLVSFTILMARSIFLIQSHSLSSLPSRLLSWAFFGYMSGFVLWVFENAACDYLSPYLYFHAAWHILAGFGTYALLQCQIAWRAETQRTVSPELSIKVRMGGGGTCDQPLPYVVVQVENARD